MKEQISVHETYMLSELHTLLKNTQDDLTTNVRNLKFDVTKFDVGKMNINWRK